MRKNVLFVTGCYPKEFDDFYVSNSKVMPQNAANVLSWRIIEGLQANVPNSFKVLTCPFIGYFPKGFKKLFIKDAKWKINETEHDQLGFINIKGLETYIKSERVYKYVRRWYKESQDNRAILIYSHYAGFLRAAGKIKRKMPDMHVSCMVTDMPEISNSYNESGIVNKIKSIPRKLMFRTTYKNLDYIDSFVLLTERMKDFLSIGQRPYCVVEGICDSALKKEDIVICKEYKKEEKEFRVVYTGTLHKRYGILNIAEAISGLPNELGITLYVCGSGDGEEELRNYSNKYSNIHFLGIVHHSKSLQLQLSSDVLVNPRPAEGIYTELSFPSKTMEYMVIGKPILCYKLAGIPDEYDNYLIYFDKYDFESIAETIKKIYYMSDEERENIGLKNQKFAIEQKGSIAQTRKILEMMGV